MPAAPRAGGKSQYELERDARVAANKERMAALGIGRAAAALAATKVRVPRISRAAAAALPRRGVCAAP